MQAYGCRVLARLVAVVSLGTLLVPGALAAQAPAPAIGRVDASRLTTGTWEYAIRVTADGEQDDVGTRTLSIQQADRAGVAAWLLVEESTSGALGMTDSLWVTRSDMRPLYRMLRMGPAELSADFTRDSITGSAKLPVGTIPFAMANAPGLIVNSGMLEAMLQVMQVRVGLRGRAPMMMVGPMGNGTVVSVQLEVLGEDTVTVPAGEYSSWTAVVIGGLTDQKVWLSKEGQRVVRMAATSPQMPGMVMETVLVREEVGEVARVNPLRQR